MRTESTFQQCIDYVDIAWRFSASVCRALTFALARLSCQLGLRFHRWKFPGEQYGKQWYLVKIESSLNFLLILCNKLSSSLFHVLNFVALNVGLHMFKM